ncbi:MAG: pyridoxamine 5'-phosphate oxidase family protein [Dehalococcoidia bacterium]
MNVTEPTSTKNLDGYGNPALPWSRALAAVTKVANGPEVTWFLGVTDPDGSPHAAGVGAAWSEDELYFVSGPRTRKSRDLSDRPAATLSARLEGIDVVFEGTVQRVTDSATLARVVRVYQDGGWPAEVDGPAFTAPYSASSAGPPPWNLYRLDFRAVYAVATSEPWGATRWKFSRTAG